jgi:uncharacterized protein YciW
MSDYIVCRRRRGRPRIAVEVCRACRRSRRCAPYQAYLNPSLFPVNTRPHLKTQFLDSPPKRH